jgi:hypothetical protein
MTTALARKIAAMKRTRKDAPKRTLTEADLEAIRALFSAEIERHLRNLSLRLAR